MKCLLIAAIVGANLLWGPSVSKAQQPNTHTGDNKAAKDKRVVPPTHAVIDPPLPAPASQPEPTKSDPQTPEKPLPRFERPEWVIVYITAVYAFISWLTLRAMKRQANTMEQQAADARDSAAAATATAQGTLKAIERQADLLETQAGHMERQTGILENTVAATQRSADAFVNSERARLAVSFREQEQSVLQILAKNSGRSPALILYAFVWVSVLAVSDKIPDVPPYLNEKEDSWSGEEEWVLPNKSAGLRINDAFEVLDLSGRSMFPDYPWLKDIEDGRSQGWVYGYVRYRDSVSGDEKVTRFCYAMYSMDGVFDLVKAGPPAYLLET
jgi:hypothetical protein